MKRKILYDITIGSVWSQGSENPKTFADVKFPEGGEFASVEIEFETDDSGKNSMKDADLALGVYMAKNHPGETYHIYYWTWLQ